jgi:class 3 adenylate cyclase
MVQRRIERKLAAVFVADVAGYSRLMELDEEGTHARLSAVQRELVGPKIREHHGRIIKNTGDGVLVEFAASSTPYDARSRSSARWSSATPVSPKTDVSCSASALMLAT